MLLWNERRDEDWGGMAYATRQHKSMTHSNMVTRTAGVDDSVGDLFAPDSSDRPARSEDDMWSFSDICFILHLREGGGSNAARNASFCERIGSGERSEQGLANASGRTLAARDQTYQNRPEPKSQRPDRPDITHDKNCTLRKLKDVHNTSTHCCFCGM